jgi:hypothetical protein
LLRSASNTPWTGRITSVDRNSRNSRRIRSERRNGKIGSRATRSINPHGLNTNRRRLATKYLQVCQAVRSTDSGRHRRMVASRAMYSTRKIPRTTRSRVCSHRSVRAVGSPSTS